MPPRPRPPLPFGFFFLDVRAVGQHDLQQVAGRGRGVDRAVEAFGDEARQQSGMVDMGVGEQHEIDCARIEREARAVFRLGFAAALEHAAIDEEARMRGFDQVA